MVFVNVNWIEFNWFFDKTPYLFFGKFYKQSNSLIYIVVKHIGIIL